MAVHQLSTQAPESNLGPTPSLRPVHVAVAVLALLYFWFWTVAFHRIQDAPFAGFANVFVTGSGDFEHFYRAAEALRHGSDLYASGAGGYIYPPLVAFLFMPLTFLKVQDAALVMLVVNMAMGLACAGFAAAEVLRRFRLASAPADVIVVAAVATLLVATRLRSEFQMWQTDVPMMLLLVLALRWLDDKPRLAGLALGMAVLIKYMPILYLPYLLLRRRFVAASWMAAGMAAFALLPALASGWFVNLQNLAIAFSGLLRLLGLPPLGPRLAKVNAMTADYSVSVTSGLARWLGPSAPPVEALAISLAVALIVVLAIARIYGAAGVATLRWPSAGTQREQPYDGIVAIEWMALIVFALAFGPQTNPRHTSLLLMAATVLSALLCLSKAGVPRWPAAAATAVLVFGLVFPPDLPGLEATLIWWRAVGGTGWCLVVMLPLLFLAGVSRVVRRDITAPLGTPERSEVDAWFGLSSTSRRR